MRQKIIIDDDGRLWEDFSPLTDLEEKAKPTQTDIINHPTHYKSGMETIDVIQAFTDGLNGIEAVCTANIIKYICRWKNKNGLEDIKKAVWYANYLIKYLEKENKDDC